MDSIGIFICCCGDGREGVNEEGGKDGVSVVGGVLVEVGTGGGGKEKLELATLLGSSCWFVSVSVVVEEGAGLETGGAEKSVVLFVDNGGGENSV